MKYINFLSLLLFSFHLSAQDAFTLSYNFGALKPQSESNQEFLKGIKKLDLEEVDSIHFIGYSDSVGTFLSNFRTTEIRSRKLKNLLSAKIKQNVPYSILPTLGEKGKGTARQINIILYTSKTLKPKPNSEEVSDGCYLVAYSELSNYLRTTSSRGRKSITTLSRSMTKSDTERPQLYYGTVNAKGEFEAKPLKWKVEKVGESWWTKKLECSEIPTDDFEKFKIFTIENEPCNQCNEDFTKNLEIEKSSLKLEIDKYLMETIQFQSPWLNQRKVKIRVPQEYVDSDADYTQDLNGEKTLIWNEKDKDYYYSTVSLQNGLIKPIYRKFPVHQDSSCQNTETLNYAKTICGPNPKKIAAYNFAEFGYHFQNGAQIPYASIGLFAATKFVDLEFLAGLHTQSAFYGSIRGRYSIVTAPLSSILRGSQWGQSIVNNRFWYTSLYVGAEYKASLGKRSNDYLEPNLNLGLTFSQNNGPTFHRIFIQYGLAVNFVEKSPRSNYSLLQVGIQFQLGKKTYAFEKGNSL